MRTHRLVAICAFLLTAIAPAQAAVPPAGSYQQSCTGATVGTDNVLHAKCRSMSGGMIDTSLRLPCAGKIDNINGRLMCSGAPAANVPQGSYLQSCADARVQDNSLHAKCRRANQTVADASLKLPCSTGKIDNLNGVLTCVGGAPRPQPQPKTVTLVVTHPGIAEGIIKGTGGIDGACRPKCEKTYDVGTAVTLVVNSSGIPNFTFEHWEGACAGQGPICKFTMDADKSTALYMKVRPNTR